MDFQTLAKRYGTPLYVYNFDFISAQYEALKSAFKARKSMICYAIKANSNLSVIAHLAKLGAGCDCVSIGEIQRALTVGVAPYKIIFSGVGKRDDEIKSALKLGILMINLESMAEMMRVEEIAKALNVTARISVRVNPNIDVKTHPYISTGLDENKFGVDIDTAKRIYLHAKHSSHLEPIGVHFHIGSQITELEPFIQAAKIIANLVKSLKALEIDIKFFDVGGGIGITYDNEETIDLYEYAQGIFSALEKLDITIISEPGRFLVGNSGIFLTQVLYEKTTKSKRFVIVDGAMNDLIRPSLYQAYHRVESLGHSEEKETLCDVVGPVCESGDFLAKDVLLPPTKQGALLVIHSAGAYGFTMSSNYNTRPRAAEVAFEGGEDRLIRPRETIEEILKLEKKCL